LRHAARTALRACLLALLLSGPGFGLPWLTATVRADAEQCIQAHERAQVERLERHYLAARDSLLVCAQSDCPRLIRGDCAQSLTELDTMLPTLVFAVSDDQGLDLLDARVFLNGQRVDDHIDGHAKPVDPGVYTVRFEAAGYTPSEHSLSVRDGEKSRLVHGTLQPLAESRAEGERASTQVVAAPPTAARARRLRRASYTLGAAAVASFALTLTSSLRGHAMLESCRDQGCSDGYAERGKLFYRTVNVSAAVGGVLLATSAVTLLTSLKSQSAGERAHVGVDARADASGASLTAWSRW
jgi:hypothetical protein